MLINSLVVLLTQTGCDKLGCCKQLAIYNLEIINFFLNLVIFTRMRQSTDTVEHNTLCEKGDASQDGTWIFQTGT
jgi:hypothetical protein